MDHEGRSMKSQMKQADKMKAVHVLILGDDDLVKDEALLTDMYSGSQEPVALASGPGDSAVAIRNKIRKP
jgi:histidyl-tRNA synthetase